MGFCRPVTSIRLKAMVKTFFATLWQLTFALTDGRGAVCLLCSPQVDTAVSYGCRSETNIAAVSLPVGDSPTSAAMYVQEASASAVRHNLLRFRCRIMHPPLSRAVRNFVWWDCNSIQKYRRDLRLGPAAGIPKNHS